MSDESVESGEKNLQNWKNGVNKIKNSCKVSTEEIKTGWELERVPGTGCARKAGI